MKGQQKAKILEDHHDIRGQCLVVVTVVSLSSMAPASASSLESEESLFLMRCLSPAYKDVLYIVHLYQ